MGTPAKLLAVKAARQGRIRDGHHANVLLGVAVAEKRQRPGSQSLVQSGDVGLDRGVLTNVLVHLFLDVGQLGSIDGSEVREVEAQPVRRHK